LARIPFHKVDYASFPEDDLDGRRILDSDFPLPILPAQPRLARRTMPARACWSLFSKHAAAALVGRARHPCFLRTGSLLRRRTKRAFVFCWTPQMRCHVTGIWSLPEHLFGRFSTCKHHSTFPWADVLAFQLSCIVEKPPRNAIVSPYHRAKGEQFRKVKSGVVGCHKPSQSCCLSSRFAWQAAFFYLLKLCAFAQYLLHFGRLLPHPFLRLPTFFLYRLIAPP